MREKELSVFCPLFLPLMYILFAAIYMPENQPESPGYVTCRGYVFCLPRGLWLLQQQLYILLYAGMIANEIANGIKKNASRGTRKNPCSQ